MAEEENSESETNLQPSFPLGRVKKIMKLDQDINKVTSEALFIVSISTDLFLQFLAEKSAEISVNKKRKTVKLEDIRIAAQSHQPTSDFLLDSLPIPSKKSNRPSTNPTQSGPTVEKSLPVGTRRIDAFFQKSANEE